MKSLFSTLAPALLATALAAPAAAQSDMPEMTLEVMGHKLTAEVASTGATRTQGLMYRRILPENRGMLFVFPNIAMHAMWMMNTYVPLSVAFIDEQGVIINIEDMAPQTQDSHPATKPAKYALEMNRGWFTKRGIRPGAKIGGIDKAPPAN